MSAYRQAKLSKANSLIYFATFIFITINLQCTSTSSISLPNSNILTSKGSQQPTGISADFGNFLKRNETFFRKSWGSDHQLCYRECYASVEDLRVLQGRFQASSLLELYYYLSATEECFCVNSGSNYEWSIDIWRSGLNFTDQVNQNDTSGTQSEEDKTVKKIVKSSSTCSFENAIYLIITLIEECRIRTLQGSYYNGANYICDTYFCRG